MITIYKVVNALTGKTYIGSTKRSVDVRWREHCTSSSSGPVYSDILEYGESNFSTSILELVDESVRYERESYWINEYWTMLGSDLMYNSQNGITRLYKGAKLGSPTQSTKDKISKALTGKSKSESHKEALSRSHSGKELSETHKRNISESGKNWYLVNDIVLKGTPELLEYLNSLGYDITSNQLASAVKGKPSKKVLREYPIVTQILKLTKEDRARGLTFNDLLESHTERS